MKRVSLALFAAGLAALVAGGARADTGELDGDPSTVEVAVVAGPGGGPRVRVFHGEDVLTGGGSQIPGLDGLAARMLGPSVRIGRPLRIPGLAHQLTDPCFASAVGLALFAAHPQDEWWDFEVPADRYPARSLRRAYRWFRNNW